MQPIVTDREACKTVEPIEMPSGLWARMGPKIHVLDGSPEVLRHVVMATNFWTHFDWLGGFRWAITFVV